MAASQGIAPCSRDLEFRLLLEPRLNDIEGIVLIVPRTLLGTVLHDKTLDPFRIKIGGEQ